MGTDKAFVVVDGLTLMERVAAAAREAGANEVTAIGGDIERLAALGLDCVPDEHPGAGPLGAIVTALAHASSPAEPGSAQVSLRQDSAEGPPSTLLMLPCDLTAPTAAALAEIVVALGTHDAAVPMVDGRAQWATAAWSTRCLQPLRAEFAAGVRAPRHAVSTLSVRQFTPSDPAALADADTPADLPPTASRPGE